MCNKLKFYLKHNNNIRYLQHVRMNTFHSSESDEEVFDPRSGLRRPSILPDCDESVAPTCSSFLSNKSQNFKSAKLSLSLRKRQAGTYFPKNNSFDIKSSESFHQNGTLSPNLKKIDSPPESLSKKQKKKFKTTQADHDGYSSQSSDDSIIPPSQNVKTRIINRRSDSIRPSQDSNLSAVRPIHVVVPSLPSILKSPIKCRLGTRCQNPSPAHFSAYIHTESSPSIESECSTVLSLGIPEEIPLSELADKAEITPVISVTKPIDEPKNRIEIPPLHLSTFSVNSSTKEDFVQHWVDSCEIEKAINDSSDSDTQPLPILADPLFADNPEPTLETREPTLFAEEQPIKNHEEEKTKSRNDLNDNQLEPASTSTRSNQSSRGMVTPRKRKRSLDNKPTTSSGKQSAITAYFTPCNSTPGKPTTVVNIGQLHSNTSISELNVTITNANQFNLDVDQIVTNKVEATPVEDEEEKAPSNLLTNAKEQWSYFMSRTNMRGTASNLQREIKKFEHQKSVKESKQPVLPKQQAIRAGPSTESRQCPFYKKIPGTGFAIDAFCYGSVTGVSSYFLSHFHYDHYRGLGKWLDKPLYCSQVTANLVNLKIKLKPGIIRVLPLNESRVIENIEVILIDANHCPGSVMFLFRFPTGKVVLHVGDFRAHPSMERLYELKQRPIDDLYLDTTYCDEHYELPSQEEVLSYIRRLVRRYASKHQKLLVISGTYTIGKEKVFMAAAEELNSKIWAPTEKRRVLNCLDDPVLSGRLIANPLEASVHVANMGDVKPANLKKYLDNLNGSFTHILALNPTGWEYDGKMAKKGLDAISPKSYYDTIFIHGVPYSEHSGFSEMKKFVRYFRPKKIIPTVNVGSAVQRKKMEAIFTDWLGHSARY